mgnify:CR=1 FL=1
MTVPVLAPQRVAVDPRLDLIEDVIGRRSIRTSGPQRIVSPDGHDQVWLLDLRPVLLDGAARHPDERPHGRLSVVPEHSEGRHRHLPQVCVDTSGDEILRCAQDDKK